MRSLSYLALGASVFLLTSCLNVFSPFDNPTSDAQLVSAARACLDRGDFNCALTDYGKLSGSDSDIANSEEAFTLYNEANIGMDTFIGAFGSGGTGAGAAVNQIAGVLSLHGGSTTRLQIFHGYQKTTSIKDPTLRGIVRFVGAIGLISEILGEMAQSPGTLKATDIAATPAACQNTGVPACASTSPTANPCHQGDNNVISGTVLTNSDSKPFSSTDDPLAAATDADVVASFGVLYTALEAAEQGLADLGVGSGSSNDFTAALTGSVDGFGTSTFITDSPTGQSNLNNTNISPCFRLLLLNEGIGS